MRSEGSRWLLLGSLGIPLACGGEVRRNTDEGTSTTQATSDAAVGGGGGPLNVGGSGVATSGGVEVLVAAAVSTTSSFGATLGELPPFEYCTSHAECPGLVFCQFYDHSPFRPQCEEGCQTDADCDPGYVCRCGDLIGECHPATCTTNADCESGSLCAAVVDTTCQTIYQYACQSAADECQTGADCGDPEPGNWCTLVDGVRRCGIRRPCF